MNVRSDGLIHARIIHYRTVFFVALGSTLQFDSIVLNFDALPV